MTIIIILLYSLAPSDATSWESTSIIIGGRGIFFSSSLGPPHLFQFLKTITGGEVQTLVTTSHTDSHKNVSIEGEVTIEGRPIAVEIVDTAPEENNRMFAYPLTDLFLICLPVNETEPLKQLLTKVQRSFFFKCLFRILLCSLFSVISMSVSCLHSQFH